MKLLSLAGIALPLSMITGHVAAYTCLSGGQPFDEAWKSQRLVHACRAAAGQYAGGETFRNCQPMGDDSVVFTWHNHLQRPSHLSADICVDRMHKVINHCGGHSDGNHGGFNVFEVFRMGFDPHEGGC